MGIWVGGSSNGMNPSTNLDIFGNTITIDGEATGIYAAHSNPAHTGWTIGDSVTGNENTITALNGNPVELYDVSNSSVSYNTLTTSASGGSNVIWSSELSDISNLVFNNNTVDYSGGSQVAFITDFPVVDTTDTTITTVTITGNEFSNWGSRALRIGDGDGAVGGSVTGVTVNSNTFNMTADTEVIGGTDTGGLTGTGNTFNVQSNAAKIQKAVDSAFVADAINVAAGTYTEDLTIDKELDSVNFTGNGSVASEIDGSIDLVNANLNLNTENDGDLTLNTITDTGVGSSLSVNTGNGTLNLDESVAAQSGITLNGGIVNVGDGVGVDKVNSGGAVSISGTGAVTIDAEIDPVTVTITSAADVTINNTVTADDLITVDAGTDGTGSVTIDNSGGNNGSLETTAAGGDITVKAGTVGGISGDILLKDDATIETSGATGDGHQITLNAYHGVINMDDGALINAGDGKIDMDAGGGDITIGGLLTTSNAVDAVTITTNAAVVDGGDLDVDVDAANGRLVIDAATGVGNGDAIETEVTTVDIDNSTSGNIEIDETDALNINKIAQATAGNIDVVADGTITVVAAQSGVSAVGAGTVDLDADGTASDLVVNDGVSSGSGKITLEADNDVTFGADGDITSVSGNVEVTADKDGVADGLSGALAMADGTVIDAGSGTIILAADENIAIGRLVTTNNTAGAVSITSTSGAVTDAGDTGGEDIEATGASAIVTIDAVTGVGNGDAIETEVTTVDIDNSTSGNIEIDETDALNINKMAQATAGNIDVVADGTITVVAAQSGVSAVGAGTVDLDADGTTSDLVVNDGVTSASGKITLEADNDVTFGADGDVTSVSGNVEVTADKDGVADGSSGALAMADGTVIDAGSGTITLAADENIAIGRLVTTNNTAGAVSITSTSGAVADAGDTGGEDIEATGASAIVTIDAVTGVGNGDAIETEVTTVDIDNSTSGNIEIDETDALNINKMAQATAGNIDVVADGTITVVAAQSGVSAVGAGTVDLDADGTTSDLVVNDGVSSASGKITLEADNDVTFGDEGDVTSVSGNVEVTADKDGVADGSSGALTMADGTVIDAGSGTITLAADENIAIGRLVTTNNTAGAVSITSSSGAVTDAGDTGGEDIEATGASAVVTIDAVTGVGNGDAIETEVATVDIDNSTSGNIEIDETDALNINKMVQANAGNIDIDATSGIQIGGSITAGGAYDITTSGGDVIFAADGKVTGSSTSSIEATAGSIANIGSDEATTIETTGAGSNLTLTAANATTQSTKPMTIVSGGDLTLNAPLDNTSSTTTLSSLDNLAINKNITDAGSISAHSGTDGTGDVTFGAGVTLDAPTINLRSGDGPGNAATAEVDIMTNTPSRMVKWAILLLRGIRT
ncbi:MAG: beta strand repeat-containing protein [Planctomycetota bacterium]